MKRSSRPPANVSLLADRIGDFIEFWGFKQVHGRIWTHLALAESPLDAGELVKRLEVSKALISLSMHDLLRYKVIRKCGKSGRGTQLYTINPEVFSVILSVLRNREKKMLSRIHGAFTELSETPEEILKTHGINPSNIQFIGGLIGTAVLALESFSERFGDSDSSVSWEEEPETESVAVQPSPAM